jgi:hypothetical protein
LILVFHSLFLAFFFLPSLSALFQVHLPLSFEVFVPRYLSWASLSSHPKPFLLQSHLLCYIWFTESSINILFPTSCS